MDTLPDDFDDIAEDYRNEQAYHDNLSTIPLPKDGMVARFWKGYDCPDSTTCDVVYIDRTSGREVLRYDGADPANTRFDYGATPDADVLARRGLNIKEMVREEDCVVSADQCCARMGTSDDWDDHGYWDGED